MHAQMLLPASRAVALCTLPGCTIAPTNTFASFALLVAGTERPVLSVQEVVGRAANMMPLAPAG